MGKADVYTGDYLENPEIFADLVNGILCVCCPAELDTTPMFIKADRVDAVLTKQPVLPLEGSKNALQFGPGNL